MYLKEVDCSVVNTGIIVTIPKLVVAYGIQHTIVVHQERIYMMGYAN